MAASMQIDEIPAAANLPEGMNADPQGGQINLPVGQKSPSGQENLADIKQIMLEMRQQQEELRARNEELSQRLETAEAARALAQRALSSAPRPPPPPMFQIKDNVVNWISAMESRVRGFPTEPEKLVFAEQCMGAHALSQWTSHRGNLMRSISGNPLATWEEFACQVIQCFSGITLGRDAFHRAVDGEIKQRDRTCNEYFFEWKRCLATIGSRQF